VLWLRIEGKMGNIGPMGDRQSGDEDDPLLFTGDTDVWIADFVWKWAPRGNWNQRNVKFQFEYLQRRETVIYLMPDGPQLVSCPA